MTERDANLIISSHGQHFTANGITVEVCIYRLEDNPVWSLDVINAAGSTIAWGELFSSDDEAWAEFRRTVEEEGMQWFLDSAKIIPFPRKIIPFPRR